MDRTFTMNSNEAKKADHWAKEHVKTCSRWNRTDGGHPGGAIDIIFD